MKKNLYILLGVILIALTSCYKDLGNYDYNYDIPQFFVDLPDTINIQKKDYVYEITPVLTLENYTDSTTLRYIWRKGTSDKWDDKDSTTIVGTDLVLGIKIQPDSANFSTTNVYTLEVEDVNTKLHKLYTTSVNVLKPYLECWMILHEENGQARLGCVDYNEGAIDITYDAYALETGVTMTGIPYGIEKTSYMYSGADLQNSSFAAENACNFFMFTSDESISGLFGQDKKLETRATVANELFISKSGDIDLVDTKDMKIFSANRIYGSLLTKGTLFHSSIYLPNFVSAYVDETSVAGDVYIEYASASSTAILAYDKIGHRFLQLLTNEQNWWSCLSWNNGPIDWLVDSWRFNYMKKVSPITWVEGNIDPEVINTDALPENIDIVFVGPGPQYFSSGYSPTFKYSVISVGLDTKDTDLLHIFSFNSFTMTYGAYDPDDMTSFDTYFTVNRPETFTEDSKIISCSAFNNILFYTSGTSLYRFDFGVEGGSAVEIYSFPESGATLKEIKFALDVDNLDFFTDQLSCDPRYQIGIGYDLSDGSGELVVLNLGVAGTVAAEGTYEYPSIQRYNEDADGKKFGPITDIEFI